MPEKVIVIGGGFAGLSAACSLAKKGYKVTILDRHDQIGGRARVFEEKGFKFDMGPSWYWMPDVFETFFAHFGKKVSVLLPVLLVDHQCWWTYSLLHA